MDNRAKESFDEGQEPFIKSTIEAEIDQKSNPSLFGNLFSSDFLPTEKALALLPYFLFLAFLGFIYIANRHQAESKIRQLTILNTEVKELKWECTSLKAKWMLSTKQSQIANSAKPLGLKESTVPPYIISVQK